MKYKFKYTEEDNIVPEKKEQQDSHQEDTPSKNTEDSKCS